jgi:hypothetical protein
MNRFAALLLAASAPLLLAPSLQAQAVELTYRFVEGADHRYEVIMNSTVTMPGGQGEIGQQQRQVLRHQVLSVDAEGNARIRNTIESVRVEVNSPMGVQVFDSEDPEAASDPMLGPMAALVGFSAEATIGPDGHILDTSDAAASVRRYIEQAPEELRPLLEQSLSDDVVEGMFQQGFQGLPEGPVSPGESWEMGIDMPMAMGTARAQFVYTLDGVDEVEGGTVARMSLVGEIEALEADPSNPMAAMMQMQGGAMSGSVSFDLTRGIVLGSDVTTNMNVAMMGEEVSTVTTVEMRLLP